MLLNDDSDCPGAATNPRNRYLQGRQSVPKSGRSERGGARNFVVYQTIAPKNLLLKVIFALNRGFLP